MWLHKQATGLKAKGSHLHQENKGQAVVRRSSLGKKLTFSLCLNSGSLLYQSQMKVMVPFPKAESLVAVTMHTSWTTVPACDSSSVSGVHLSLPHVIHSRLKRHSSGP